MGRIILTYNDLDALNQFLKEKGHSYSVHMHDLCQSQSFTIKSSGLDSEEYGPVRKDISDYFDTKGILVQFSENGLDFVLN